MKAHLMERCNVKDIMEFRFKFRYEMNGMKNYLYNIYITRNYSIFI